ncbi:MAG TPA: hypothetical protein VF510_00115 [Ktedonobacterales bacterium]
MDEQTVRKTFKYKIQPTVAQKGRWRLSCAGAENSITLACRNGEKLGRCVV